MARSFGVSINLYHDWADDVAQLPRVFLPLPTTTRNVALSVRLFALRYNRLTAKISRKEEEAEIVTVDPVTNEEYQGKRRKRGRQRKPVSDFMKKYRKAVRPDEKTFSRVKVRMHFFFSFFFFVRFFFFFFFVLFSISFFSFFPLFFLLFPFVFVYFLFFLSFLSVPSFPFFFLFFLLGKHKNLVSVWLASDSLFRIRFCHNAVSLSSSVVSFFFLSFASPLLCCFFFALNFLSLLSLGCVSLI